MRGRVEGWDFERREGLIAEELLAAAKDIGAVHPQATVVIAVGSSSHVTHRVVGSVAVGLARHSPVPLAVVPRTPRFGCRCPRHVREHRHRRRHRPRSCRVRRLRRARSVQRRMAQPPRTPVAGSCRACQSGYALLDPQPGARAGASRPAAEWDVRARSGKNAVLRRWDPAGCPDGNGRQHGLDVG